MNSGVSRIRYHPQPYYRLPHYFGRAASAIASPSVPSRLAVRSVLRTPPERRPFQAPHAGGLRPYFSRQAAPADTLVCWTTCGDRHKLPEVQPTHKTSPPGPLSRGEGVTLRVPQYVTPPPGRGRGRGLRKTSPLSRWRGAGGEGARRPMSHAPSPLSRWRGAGGEGTRRPMSHAPSPLPEGKGSKL